MGRVVEWEKPTVVKSWDNGYQMVRIRTCEDMKLLGQNGGGCALDHAFWTEKAVPRLEYFFLLQQRGELKAILFTKLFEYHKREHPQAHITRYKNHRVSHDLGYDPGRQYTSPMAVSALLIRDIERGIARYQVDYEKYKTLALGCGIPLGHNNPYKYEMDEANRRVAAYKQRLKDIKTSKGSISDGNIFTWKGKKLIVCQVMGIGGYEVNSPLMDYLVDFCYGKKEG